MTNVPGEYGVIRYAVPKSGQQPAVLLFRWGQVALDLIANIGDKRFVVFTVGTGCKFVQSFKQCRDRSCRVGNDADIGGVEIINLSGIEIDAYQFASNV